MLFYTVELNTVRCFQDIPQSGKVLIAVPQRAASRASHDVLREVAKNCFQAALPKTPESQRVVYRASTPALERQTVTVPETHPYSEHGITAWVLPEFTVFEQETAAEAN